MKKLQGAAKSKTIWFNVICGSLITALPQLQDALPSLQQFIPQEIYRLLIVGVVIGNIVLRAITTKALEDK